MIIIVDRPHGQGSHTDGNGVWWIIATHPNMLTNLAGERETKGGMEGERSTQQARAWLMI